MDFVPEDGCIPGRFQASAGGASCNVACGLGKLGARTALLARAGKDALGRSIVKTAKECGVDTEYIQIDEKRFKTLTVVMPKSEDMLRYAIYRNDSADSALAIEEIPEELFQNMKILHYGNLAAATEQSRQTMKKAIEKAKKYGAITSLDVNLRPNSWPSKEDMITESKKLIEVSDIIKMTRNKAELLGIDQEETAIKQGKIVIVTDGGDEAVIRAGGIVVSRKPEVIPVVDVTGGGAV